VGYEFLAAGKPVVYVDCPKFYEHTVLPRHPHLTLDDCLARDTINGGRRYGAVVTSVDELPNAVIEAYLDHDVDRLQKRLLYNPGQATKALLDTLACLFPP